MTARNHARNYQNPFILQSNNEITSCEVFFQIISQYAVLHDLYCMYGWVFMGIWKHMCTKNCVWSLCVYRLMPVSMEQIYLWVCLSINVCTLGSIWSEVHHLDLAVCVWECLCVYIQSYMCVCTCVFIIVCLMKSLTHQYITAYFSFVTVWLCICARLSVCVCTRVSVFACLV